MYRNDVLWRHWYIDPWTGGRVLGAIQGMRKLGANDDSIISAVMDMFNVSKEYVLTLLKTQVASS